MIKNIVKQANIRLYGLMVLVLIASSCNDDEPKPANPNTDINDWILEEMNFWYYWNTSIPSAVNKSLEPDAFFSSLLSSEDRFSWIQKDYQELLNSLQGISKEAGYEFVLYREGPTNNNVVAQVVYVKPHSPASLAHLKRGDLITHINGTQITTSNYSSLLNQISEHHSITYKPIQVDTQDFGNSITVPLSTIEYAENPNYLDTVYTIDDKKIGYFVYNFFANGTSSNETAYINQTDDVFSRFQAKGITHLIIDLRFNSGGLESSATNLASLIGKNVNSTKIFAKREYNPGVTAAIKQDGNLGEAFLTVLFNNKAQNVGHLLNTNTIYIITSTRTASASELVINGLKPYMNVVLIGDTTRGKNVGSISRFKENDPKNTWGMQPIVVKILNSLDQSDYSNGFVPTIADEDRSILLYPLGDTKENLLQLAIGEITGTGTGRRDRHAKVKTLGRPLGNSLETKKRGGLIIETHPFDILQ